ncbi:MAG: NADH:flavin oxidoreductase [Polyangiaceae bacterium]|nr:NADH:flavin oxidoreductase [Polyangiaceae bacterium]
MTQDTATAGPSPEALAPLLQPFELGSLSLKNRLAMAPMTRNFSPGNIPGADVAAYYERRALGGVGLIISEGTLIDHPAASGYPDVPFFHGESALAGWQRVVSQVHAAGGKFAPQLWHCGSVRQLGMPPDPSVGGVAPSAVAHPGAGVLGGSSDAELPHALSESEIADIISAFAGGAADAVRIGCDAAEFHGAHGYLIDQFFWDKTNQRTDGWGGDFVARTRFAVEILKAARKEVPPDFPLIFRFSQWKLGGYRDRLVESPAELERWLTPLVDAGVDIFHCSTRRYFQPEFEGSELNLAGWTKQLTGKPTISVGSVGLDTDFFRTNVGAATEQASIEPLLERLGAGEFDLIAVGRALLADAEWLTKLTSGRAQEIVGFQNEMKATLY